MAEVFLVRIKLDYINTNGCAVCSFHIKIQYFLQIILMRFNT